VQLAGNHPALHRQHRLDQAGDAGSRFEMADVGFHRADQQRPVGLASPSVDSRCGLHLDRVSESGSGPMRLEVVHRRRRHVGPGKRRLDDPLLGLAIGRGGTCAGPVLVDRRAADHAPDAVAVGLGFTEPFQNQHAAAFASDKTVRGSIEGLALTVARQHAQLRHLPGHGGRKERVHAPHQGLVHFAVAQGHYRLVRGNQRRRAVQFHRNRRAFQAQLIGNTAHRHAGGGAEVAHARFAGFHQVPVLAGSQADVYAGAAPAQAVRVHSRVFHGLPARLQQHSLPRVQHARLDRRNPEEPGVELVDLVHEPALAVGGELGRQISRAIGPGT